MSKNKLIYTDIIIMPVLWFSDQRDPLWRDVNVLERFHEKKEASKARDEWESLYWRGLKPGAGSADDRDHGRQDHLLQKRTTTTRWPLTYNTWTWISATLIHLSNFVLKHVLYIQKCEQTLGLLNYYSTVNGLKFSFYIWYSIRSPLNLTGKI